MRTLEENVPPFEPRLRTALSSLDARSSDVLDRRYGLSTQPQTLGEVGVVYGVTGERIRQIEAKALRLMRQSMKRYWPAFVQWLGADAWLRLAGDGGFVRATDEALGRRQLSPWHVLALDIGEMNLDTLLDGYAQAFEAGWVAPDWSFGELVAIRDHLEQRLRWIALPCSVYALAQGASVRMENAVLTLTGLHFFGTYVLRGPPNGLTRRALWLHALLTSSGRALEIVELATKYRTQMPLDRCTARDCEIAMQAQNHLFIEVLDGCWAALGAAGEVPMSDSATDMEDVTGKIPQFEDPQHIELQTIAESIESELRGSGPSRISRLVERAPEFLPPGRSGNSVGRTLVTMKDVFARPLPGVYALHDQVPSPTQLLSAPPPYMFRVDQLRLYALARRAGEPWGSYPLWLPESEYLWCVWAQEHANPELFQSLLSIVRLDAWPEVEGMEGWSELARKRGRFSLQFPPGPGAFELPKLERVLAACVYVRQHGYLGWISANRILLRHVQGHRAAGLLALLVALRILDPDAEDWQARHRPGVLLDRRFARLEEERIRPSRLNWETECGCELRSQALSAEDGGGWASQELIKQLFGQG